MYIIAEIGCNHNGDAMLAKSMVDKAKECGVDAVKFQTFDSKQLISRFAPKADYQLETTDKAESQLEMTAKLELSHDEYMELKQYSESIGLDVFSTPFDIGSIEFLQSCGQTVWKIPSGEITNLPYLEAIAKVSCDNKKIILSTGMATIAEIQKAVDILESGEVADITILHCNTEYPTPDNDVNLQAILDLQANFRAYNIGLSDHSIGITAAIVAVGFGITCIEKHFTLDKNFYGPDHKASITPDELSNLCTQIRRAEVMLGSQCKHVTKSEHKNKLVARKSIVAKRDIKAGEVFSVDNITTKRPGNGISPMRWYDVLGKVAQTDFCEDELLVINEIPWDN
ncbi:MAG: N-acetylneuraminate synthase [Epulopiscium sp. Nuni2H_MBin001]|nr:MAG: N-acetylneuraminate synthase [Epulopiscium sp. Nuni2H_MBin001]